MRIRGLAPSILIAAAAALAAGSVSADVVHLKGGGKVVGKVVSTADGKIRVQTVAGTLSFSASEAVSIDYQPTPEEVYAERVAAVDRKDTGALLALADWCAGQGLRTQEDEALRWVLGVDPNDADARRRLGFVRAGDAWLSREDAMKAKGLVEFRGRWVTSAERDRLEKEDLDRRITNRWRATIAAAAERLGSTSPATQNKALQELLSIKDPLAIKPLVAVIGATEEAGVRESLTGVLGRFRDDQAVDALIDMSLLDEDPGVRKTAVGALAVRDDPRIPPEYVKALKQDSWTLKQRACYALGELRAFEAVPDIIQNLTAIEWRPRQVSWSWRRGGFSQGTSSTYIASFRLRTAAGAIAMEPVLGDVGDTTRVFAEERGPAVRKRPVRTMNTEAWAALVKISARDLGYFEDQWTAWYEQERTARRRAAASKSGG